MAKHINMQGIDKATKRLDRTIVKHRNYFQEWREHYFSQQKSISELGEENHSVKKIEVKKPI